MPQHNKKGVLLGKPRSVPKDPKYLFADPAELEHRPDAGYAAGENPAEGGPTFKQIEAAQTSKNIADAKPDARSGNQKFGSV